MAVLAEYSTDEESSIFSSLTDGRTSVWAEHTLMKIV